MARHALAISRWHDGGAVNCAAASDHRREMFSSCFLTNSWIFMMNILWHACLIWQGQHASLPWPSYHGMVIYMTSRVSLVSRPYLAAVCSKHDLSLR